MSASSNVAPLYTNTNTNLCQLQHSLRSTSLELSLARSKHSIDVVVKDEFLPDDVVPGDLIAVPGTGAYCRSMASQYNHVPRPPVVAVRDGEARVLLRRETEDDLLALDVG